MASWFKRGRSDEETADPTVEVKAQVIADAVRAGQPDSADGGQLPAAGSDGGIAADGLIAGGDFAAGLTVAEADAADGLDDDAVSQAFAERKSLVHLCLYALDRARTG